MKNFIDYYFEVKTNSKANFKPQYKIWISTKATLSNGKKIVEKRKIVSQDTYNKVLEEIINYHKNGEIPYTKWFKFAPGIWAEPKNMYYIDEKLYRYLGTLD